MKSIPCIFRTGIAVALLAVFSPAYAFKSPECMQSIARVGLTAPDAMLTSFESLADAIDTMPGNLVRTPQGYEAQLLSGQVSAELLRAALISSTAQWALAVSSEREKSSALFSEMDSQSQDAIEVIGLNLEIARIVLKDSMTSPHLREPYRRMVDAMSRYYMSLLPCKK